MSDCMAMIHATQSRGEGKGGEKGAWHVLLVAIISRTLLTLFRPLLAVSDKGKKE